MPSYEMTVILKKMAHPHTVSALKRVAEEIYISGGYIRKMQSLGTRTLPNIKIVKGVRHSEGTYVHMDFDVKTTDIPKLKDEYRRDREIIQHWFMSKTDETFKCAETLDDEMKPPAERPSIQTMIEQGRRPPRFKKIFDSKTGLGYYPFHR